MDPKTCFNFGQEWTNLQLLTADKITTVDFARGLESDEGLLPSVFRARQDSGQCNFGFFCFWALPPKAREMRW